MRMFKSAKLLLTLGGLAAAALPAYAHHSFPATYLVDQKMTIEGTVIQFMVRTPHSFVHVMTKDKKTGATIKWSIEWGAGDVLASEKVMQNTLKPGDKVIVTGNPARDPTAHRLRMQSIQRPADGWKWAGTFG